MSQLFVVTAFFAVLAIANAGEDDSIQFEFVIDASKDVKINNAQLDWGKWMKSYDDPTEIPYRGVIVVAKTKSYRIAACGRAFSPSGTKGSFELQDVRSGRRYGKVRFDKPYAGPLWVELRREWTGEVYCELRNKRRDGVVIHQYKIVYCKDVK